MFEAICTHLGAGVIGGALALLILLPFIQRLSEKMK